MEDPDFLMALELQKQFDMEADDGADSDVELKDFKYDRKELIEFKKKKWAANRKNELDETCNLVHPLWETVDPTPDVFSLFGAFDDKFFQGKLKCVTLEWSKRMYACAGICYSRRNRLGMAITIRLSEPLLKLRSRKDLVETLLHEMIHAYLSVLHIKEGNGGHGPNFKKIMQTINKVAGTNITVYHTFHDEVDVYKTHWWRCNGICQNRKPFFGYVKRTSNRAPGPNDVWWRQHVESCGGSFLKIKEPEKKIKSSGTTKNNKIDNSKPDIRKFFGDTKPAPKNFSTGIKSNGGGTVVVNSKNNFIKDNNCPKSTSNVGSSQKPSGNLANVVGFKDLTTSPTTAVRPITFDDGPGRCLGSTPSTDHTPSIDNNRHKNIEREKVRNAWANRFPASNSTEKDESPAKKPRIEIVVDSPTENEAIEPVASSSPVQQKDWIAVDDDVMLKEEQITIVDISSDDDDDEQIERDVKPNINRNQSMKNCTAQERQQIIKQEIIDAEDDNEDEIEILDDDYDDNYIIGVVDIADTSLIDDIFGEDTLMKDFKTQNGIYSTRDVDYLRDSNHDIIMCPICQERIIREVFPDHLDGCTGIQKKIQVLPSTSKIKKQPSYTNKKQNTKNSALLKEIVPNAMRQSSSNTLNSSTSSEDNETESSNRRRNFLDTSKHSCPVCAQDVEVDKINQHLDVCLKDE